MSNFFPMLQRKTEKDDYCPSLSFKTRLYCFGACFLIGICLSLLGWLVLISPRPNKLRTFAVLFTLGSIIAIAGSMFLRGPVSQAKSMFKKKRWIPTSIYLGALVMTLVAALKLKDTTLTLLFLVIQIVAYCWYAITYIPCGERMVKKCFKGIWSCCND